ncbi:MAG TPA: hypothetical protein PKD50_01500 [Leptospiraceae bacterium]|nr:hypothetical protein [Leptospiraceae bacterium]HNK56933.1 hypothetical protein [Leptospiraceae bacterium]HNK95655.1 hypothetical protein [Leptospiraceae bacterium]
MYHTFIFYSFFLVFLAAIANLYRTSSRIVSHFYLTSEWLKAKKVEIISKITRLIDYSVLLELEKILAISEQQTNEWDSLTALDKAKIEKGLDSIQKGKVISHSMVKEKIDQFIKEL